MHPLRRALVYLRPYWLTTFGAFVSLVLVTAANLYNPPASLPPCPFQV